MAAGLFELRRDAITGWWVATIVDRAFHRDRFARAAAPVETEAAARTAASPRVMASGCGSSRTSRSTSSGPRRRRASSTATSSQVAIEQARASGSWRTVVAPPGEHRPLQAVGDEMIGRCSGGCRDAIAEAMRAGQTAYVQVVQNWGAQAGARTNHLCLDLYDLPQVPHRVAEEIGGAARFVIREGECPFCRLVRDEVRRPDRLLCGTTRERRLRAVRVALAVRGLDRAPRRHARTSAAASDADLLATAEALRRVLGLLAALDGPPYNLVLHTAPLRERVDAHVPLALGDPPPPARDRGARAGHRPAGQPRFAGGRRRGAAPIGAARRADARDESSAVTRLVAGVVIRAGCAA